MFQVTEGGRARLALLFFIGATGGSRPILLHGPRPPPRARLQASLAVAGTLFLWWRLGGVVLAVVAGLAGSLALLAWLSPPHYAPVQRVLDRILHLLLAGLTWLLFAAIYLGVFTPLRLWRALTGQDPLQRRPDPAAPTYLRPVPPAAPGRFDRQF